ncbi:caspase family protein [Streptomyces sp. NBC_00378]|uniref:HD domain-containing protein n=1 Tax=unclassified Streptomyces TaxID=2593676 RepID=UPI00224F4E86|nr:MULTISPECIES: caspase family protein [unclassified Streptomyces]MCX5113994.1 caspase family protein [Streptomyces sp. NBC_00378]
MGNSRQALLIAVPQYELSDHFPDLTQAVQRDVELMDAALRSSGYSVETLGLSSDRPALRSRIVSAISRVCCTAPEDGTVLIHFTGHGLSVDGADYLVPSEAQLNWSTDPPHVDADSLIGLDLTTLLKGCKAGTVLLSIDACRDAQQPDGVGSFGGPATNFPSWRDRVAVVFGCAAGQTCGSDELQGSHFTRALADALASDTSPRTVSDVISHTVRRTAEFARTAQHEQRPTVHYAPSGPAAIAGTELCTGKTLQEEWSVAIRDPELWAAVQCGEDRRSELQKALERLALECARLRAQSLTEIPDPWADDGYPVRVLASGLRALLAPSVTLGGPLLDPSELAVLLAAPFVREAVYAMGVKEAAAASPYQLEPAVSELGCGEARIDLEHTFAAHPLIWRKGRELASRGAKEEAGAVAAWLMHRHVAGREELWDTYAPGLLAPLASALLGTGEASARSAELMDGLMRVCRQTAVVPAQPYAGEREPAEGPQGPEQVVPRTGPAERWRPRELSWLIGLAGLLGGDLRDMPGVLVDNVGVTDGLVPAQAVAGVQELRWSRDRLGASVDLDLPCPHPAVHAALETLTGWADDAVQHIKQHLSPGEAGGPLTHLPERVTCHKLRPAGRGDAYGLPLMRFSLAEDEMRELLMGSQLYGDRALALRELYQNALDACRYRSARVRYGELKGGIRQGWDGEIVFRQGVDDDGRPYVECEDNGVGMGQAALRSTFSRAGRRFEQSREYRREQARWRAVDKDLRLYPNSRFGIGVFSYFMLADEISIWTRVTDEFGRPESGRGLRVDIASSGSLFRIKESDAAQPGGGTRVRLYLNSDAIDVADELAKRVWLCDYTMRVERSGAVVKEWEKDVLYYDGDSASPVRADRNVWWVPGPGCLLVDGIWTPTGKRDAEAARSFSARLVIGDEPMYGCVVDLRETHSPDLDTSRTRILEFDKDWVSRHVRELAEHMDLPPWFSVEWLWNFAHAHRGGAQLLVNRLLEADAVVASTTSWDRGAGVSLRGVGCLPVDVVLHTGTKPRDGRHGTLGSAPPGLVAWRVAALRSVRIPVDDEFANVPAPESLAGYPQPLPWESGMAAGDYGSRIYLEEAVVPRPGDRPTTFAGLLHRLRRYAIAGVRVPVLPDLDAAYAMELDAVDCELLTDSRLFSKSSIRTWTSNTEDAEPERAPVLSVLNDFSLRAGLPWREALARAERFSAAGFPLEPLGLDLGTVPADADAVATKREIQVLRLHPEFAGDERPLRLDEPPSAEEYEQVIRRYGWLGMSADAEMAEFEGSFDVMRMFADVEAAFEYRHWQKHGPSPRFWALAAARTSTTVGEVYERFAPWFESKELSLPDLDGLKDRSFTKLESALVAEPTLSVERYGWYKGREWASPHLAPLAEIAVNVRRSLADTTDIVGALTSLAESGLVDAAAPGLVDRWLTAPPDGMGLLMPWTWDLTWLKDMSGPTRLDSAYAVLAAAARALPLGAVYARLAEMAPLLGVETEMLPLPDDLAEARVSVADVEASCEWTPEGVRWLPGPDVAKLVQHARSREGTLGDSVRELSRFAVLGSPWKPQDDMAAAEWAKWRPTQHDTAMFLDDLAGDRPVGPVDLLRVAARFGWPMGRAWDRLALYRPFGVELLVERTEFSGIPLWQDLILLTEEYTGRAPALGGRVSGERIAVSARELEWTTAAVVERLKLYAGVFGLEVPDTYPDAPAPTPPAEPYRAAANERSTGCPRPTI